LCIRRDWFFRNSLGRSPTASAAVRDGSRGRAASAVACCCAASNHFTIRIATSTARAAATRPRTNDAACLRACPQCQQSWMEQFRRTAIVATQRFGHSSDVDHAY